MEGITYRALFDYLGSIGFEDTSPSLVDRVFEHTESGILLAFSMGDDLSIDRRARDADVMSVEVKLQYYGLLADSIVAAAQLFDAP